MIPWRLLYGLPWLAASAALMAGTVAPRLAEAAAPGIFLASAALLGLPHGAADPWVPQWAERRNWTFKGWITFLVAYLLATGATLLLWRWQRTGAAAGFLALTVWHWGSADASWQLRPGWRWAALALGRGLVVIAGPLALQPAASRAVLAALAGSAETAAAVQGLGLPLLAAGVLLEAVTLSLAALERITEPGAWRQPLWHLGETALLLAMFRVLPPAMSVGVYFVFFHAWRHLERLAELRADALGEARTGNAAGRVLAFYRQVWPLALAALAALPLLRRFLATPAAGEGDWLTAYLVLLSALTVPHAALVLWLDRRASSR